MNEHGHRRMRFDPYPLATIHRRPPATLNTTPDSTGLTVEKLKAAMAALDWASARPIGEFQGIPVVSDPRMDPGSLHAGPIEAELERLHWEGVASAWGLHAR